MHNGGHEVHQHHQPRLTASALARMQMQQHQPPEVPASNGHETASVCSAAGTRSLYDVKAMQKEAVLSYVKVSRVSISNLHIPLQPLIVYSQSKEVRRGRWQGAGPNPIWVGVSLITTGTPADSRTEELRARPRYPSLLHRGAASSRPTARTSSSRWTAAATASTLLVARPRSQPRPTRTSTN